MAKLRNWSRVQNFAKILHFCPPWTLKNLKYAQNLEIGVTLKFC